MIADVISDRILITGGTGTLGQELIRQLLSNHQPTRVSILSRDEAKQHKLQEKFQDPRLRWFIGDVRDLPRLRRAMDWTDLVIHCAAMKQVPACEYNPFEAVQTNVIGAQNVIEAAMDCGIKRVLAISTDKATAPTNLYGATKLCAEKLFCAASSYAGFRNDSTRFAVVRYGNVLGSTGSVLQVWSRQREHANPITITDRRMTRFWITIQDAARFVLDRLESIEPGTISVPKMLACDIMTLASAYYPNAPIQEIGIRHGEKLAETIISSDEAHKVTEESDRFVIHTEAKGLMPEGWSYRSDNAEQLTKEDLKGCTQIL